MISVAAGELRVKEAPEDTLFQVSLKTPLLIRRVEMYQYCFVSEKYSSGQDRNGRDIYRKYVEKRFSGLGQGTETAYDNPEFKGSTKRYENPEFPKDLESKSFYGETEIGESGVCLSEHLAAKFKKRYMIKVPKENLSQNIMKKYDLMLVSDGTYATRKDEDWEIGDIRVTFTMADPEMLTKEYTAVGKISEESGQTYIGEEFEGLLLNGATITKEDAIKKYQETSEKDGSGFLFLGIGLFIVVFLVSLGVTALTGQMGK